MTLAASIFAAGLVQLGILLVSAQIPTRLRWREELRELPRLHRQLHWIYGGYVMLATLAFATVSLLCAEELAARSPLARLLSAYIALFWLIRLALQPLLDVRPYLSTRLLRAGYHALTPVFALLAAVYGAAAL